MKALRRLPSRRGLKYAEWLCWMLAGALMLPQAAAMAARGVLEAGPGDSWSSSRRTQYARVLEEGGLPAPIGRLRLAEQGSSVPVFTGTGEVALTLGAGHLPETASLAGTGNIAIAGHRDGFFRSLRHIRPGHRLVLESDEGARTFQVAATRVVSPQDVWVLDDTSEPTLTLITCHPFYHVGHAPNRYVVRARLVADSPQGSTPAADGSLAEIAE